MVEFEVIINKSGINSIEAPEEVDLENGENIVLNLVNNGTPLHLTVSAVNGRKFTPFLHENLFLENKVILKIPVMSDAPKGTFRIEIITGYGTVRYGIAINVTDRAIEIPEEIEEIPEPEDHTALYMKAGFTALIGAGWVLYIFGLYAPGVVPGIIPIILITAAAYIGWQYRP
ncbi:DUF7524 family protein [Methanoplanus endosymbiosus]|uniref:Uncharacterized protein n=1 Tax=Methanoplanus endosymbiosus TaxID=33865 RepID=A0A9E7PMD7_9EURY|nr:hypothetical protein [Methanoplanus endosymbiosus]UUX91311.1 hypothetical protein L6E24_07940 [Methanoplanus endosymbiosus]